MNLVGISVRAGGLGWHRRRAVFAYQASRLGEAGEFQASMPGDRLERVVTGIYITRT